MYWKTKRDIWPSELPPEPAVYVIYFDGELCYIGSTKNLRHRISGHGIRLALAGGYWTPWGEFNKAKIKYRLSQRYGDWAMIELRLIRRLRPRFNRAMKRGVLV